MSEIVPVTREEKLVDAIIDSEVIADKGVTRAEKYLEHIMNGTTATEEPVTRAEHYLAKIAGMDVQLEEPVTRVEIYLAAIAGMTVDPPAPVTRLEKLLAEWVEAAAGELKTVTGAVVAVSDALARKAEDLIVAINPVQSGTGTPSPDNVRPITGHEAVNVTRTGRNILDDEFESGSINISNGEPIDDPAWRRSKNYVSVCPNTTYYVKAESGIFAKYYDRNQNAITTRWDLQNKKNAEFTTDSNAYFMKVVFAVAMDVSDFCVNYPSTATAYTPYVGDTYDVQFGEAGTVYGGQLDVTTGVLTVDNVKLSFPSPQPWQWFSSGSTQFWYTYFPNADVPFNNDFRITENGIKLNLSGTQRQVRVYGNNQDIAVTIDGDTDMVSLMGSYGFVYLIAEPHTYQLTPTEITMLLGDNNVWSDTGDSTLKYWAEV